jgi:hypothetical protein
VARARPPNRPRFIADGFFFFFPAIGL